MSALRVAMMQPTFLPWQGFFGLVAAADAFVFLDDFQFSRQSWQQRNRIFVAREKADWVTVPVDRSQRGGEWPTLLETRPVLGEFRRKFLATVRQSYAKSEHRAAIEPEIEAWLAPEWASLAEMNMDFIRRASGWLGLRAKFLRSSELGHDGKRSEAVIDLLRRAGATTYLAARGSFGYMRDDGLFPAAGIETVFQCFEPAPYPQRHSAAFVPYLSVLDALLQVGCTETQRLVDAGTRPFVPWNDMLRAAPAPAGEPGES